MNYIAFIHKDKKSGYGVSFPDFPGCVTVGDTLDEAHQAAAEALAFHIEGIQEDGEAIPAPSSLETALSSDLAEDHQAVIVVQAKLAMKPKRVNVMMDSDLLRRIDAITNNRSAFLSQAARNELARTPSQR